MQAAPFVVTVVAFVTMVFGVVVGDDSKSGRDTKLPADTLPADLFDRELPLGLDDRSPPPTGVSAAEQRARFDIGRRLFFDPILSKDKTVSCATCHRPDHGFSSPERLPRGVGGKLATRHAPSLFNRSFGKFHSWDGRAASLKEQALLPIANPLEMGLPHEEAFARILASEYHAEFSKAFDEGVTVDNIGIALASFLDRLYSAGSRVDRFVAGTESTLTPSEKGGLWLYESKGKCWKCHSGRNFTDEKFHNTGVGVRDGKAEPGRFGVTGKSEERGAFKTPTLRGVALNPPYMHDGSLATLREVVEFYRKGGIHNDHLDTRVEPLDLSDDDVDDLVAFLEALSR